MLILPERLSLMVETDETLVHAGQTYAEFNSLVDDGNAQFLLY